MYENFLQQQFKYFHCFCTFEFCTRTPVVIRTTAEVRIRSVKLISTRMDIEENNRFVPTRYYYAKFIR